MDYLQEWKYALFLQESANNEARLISAINEAIAISESGTNLNYIIEAGFIDKVKATVNKLIEFLKKLFAKFVENVNNVFASEATYVEKYKDIILHRKLLEQTFTMHRYDIGLKRIASEKIPPFSFNLIADGDKEGILKDDETFQKELLKNDPNFNGSQDFPDECKSFFMGSEDEEEIASTQINMTNIYNFCKDKNAIVLNITRDKDTLIQAANNSINAVNKYAQDMLAKRQANKRQEDARKAQSANTTSQQQTGNAQQSTPTGESALYESSLYNLIVEIGTDLKQTQVNAKASSQNGASSKTTNGPGANGSLKQATTARSADSVAVPDETNKEAGERGGAMVDSEEDLNRDMQELNGYVNRYISNCNTFIAAKCTALDAALKDYMFILHTHVKQQLTLSSKPAADQATPMGTNYNSGNAQQQNNNNNNNNNNNTEQPPANNQQQEPPKKKLIDRIRGK